MMPKLRQIFVFSLTLLPMKMVLACGADANFELFGQIAAVQRNDSVWEIAGKSPYTSSNGYSNLALKYSDSCDLIENKLKLDVSLYGLAYGTFKNAGVFEQNDHQAKLLIDQFRFTYNISDGARAELGKMRSPEGLFYLKSPASLLNNYYAGFKSIQIYDPSLDAAYKESFWGISFIQDMESASISATIAPKLTDAGKSYVSSNNWSAVERSNSNERYLLRYTDYHSKRFTPSFSVLLGDSPAVALANSYNLTEQLTINTELAWHQKQSWRHLNADRVQQVENYVFPTDLYRVEKKQNLELALGMVYTTNQFSQFGLEYYFQSAGYSQHEWNRQRTFLQFLNQRTGYAPLDNAFDAYKYLMASEISNVVNRGNLQGKHYLNGYASILLNDQAKIKPYIVVNLRDKSSISGVTYSQAVNIKQKQIDVYTGIYAALGNKHSEFGLFGENIGSYVGFHYNF